MFSFRNKDKNKLNLADALMDWYDQCARTLPWRTVGPVKSEPYFVWLSEIMLQQTTVVTVTPYFKEFLKRWPTVEAMAQAELDDILHAWQGLGYYARARNLHKCARVISSDFGGKFPDNETQLLTLPGIGPYTAAAISAIAFGRPTVPVDGNIERVISRLYAMDDPVRQSKHQVQAAAQKILPINRPGDFAQAMMDLGATVCRPKSPLCDQCPWVGACKAYKLTAVEAYPVKLPKKQKPTRHGVAFWLENSDRAVWVRKRPEKGLLGGMVEIPSTDWRETLWTEEEAREIAPLSVQWSACDGEVSHTFTHFHLKLTVWRGVTSAKSNADGFWCHPDKFSELALPTLMKKVVKNALVVVGDQR